MYLLLILLLTEFVCDKINWLIDWLIDSRVIGSHYVVQPSADADEPARRCLIANSHRPTRRNMTVELTVWIGCYAKSTIALYVAYTHEYDQHFSSTVDRTWQSRRPSPPTAVNTRPTALYVDCLYRARRQSACRSEFLKVFSFGKNSFRREIPVFDENP